jgi:hypothetical protein
MVHDHPVLIGGSLQMSVLDETHDSLSRIQKFDTSTLPRREELGARFAFDDAVEPANRLVNLFNKLPADSLAEYPEEQLKIVKSGADQVYQLFQQVAEFNETEPDAASRKSQIVSSITDQYSSLFKSLYPLISYSVARTVDFNRLEEQGRAAVQAIDDQTQKLLSELETTKTQADETLREVQAAAAEQGVSQQAHYFKAEADREATEAETWRKWTYVWAASLALYGASSFFLHKWDLISPDSLNEALLFISSKLIIFVVLTYLLILSARNFMSHKHNSVVNRHRQNALQTFQALVSAGSTDVSQDIILNHAASCIFTPQETGYTRTSSATGSSNASMTELVYRTAIRGDAPSNP